MLYSYYYDDKSMDDIKNLHNYDTQVVFLVLSRNYQDRPVTCSVTKVSSVQQVFSKVFEK